MCLYPKLIPNRRYLPSKKNGGVPPACPDERLRYVTAACGDYLECRQQKQRAWKATIGEGNPLLLSGAGLPLAPNILTPSAPASG